VTHLRKLMLEELQGRKFTALVLGPVQKRVVRFGIRGFGVPGSSSRYGVASIVC
jgi:hypothetical protein